MDKHTSLLQNLHDVMFFIV